MGVHLWSGRWRLYSTPSDNCSKPSSCQMAWTPTGSSKILLEPDTTYILCCRCRRYPTRTQVAIRRPCRGRLRRRRRNRHGSGRPRRGSRGRPLTLVHERRKLSNYFGSSWFSSRFLRHYCHPQYSCGWLILLRRYRAISRRYRAIWYRAI